MIRPDDRDQALDNQQFDDPAAPPVPPDESISNPDTPAGKQPRKDHALIRLRDADETIAESDEDVRGRKVIDKDGTELGKVRSLFIDPSEQRVRFLEVASGGFLGLGRTDVLIPVDTITRITTDHVHIDQDASLVERSPAYNPDLTDQVTFESTYGYYGLLPYWGAGNPSPSDPPPERDKSASNRN